MEGLKPSIARYIGIIGNETLSELKKNVRNYELVEFMITGNTPKTSFDIKTEIIQSKMQQINKDNNSKKPEVNKLREEVEDLKLNSEKPKQKYVDNNSTIIHQIILTNIKTK